MEYDVMVVGGGIIGRSIALRIKETITKENILLIDQFSMSESHGSSKGRSKGIQRANWNKDESDAMKQWNDDSIIEWEHLEHISSRTIVTKSKALFIGPAESAVIKYTLISLKKYPESEQMKFIDTLQQDYPKINFSVNCVGILDTSELCLDADEILKHILFTKDKKPIIRRHPKREDIFLAVGMSGTGFGYSPAISNIVCDLVFGKEPKYDICEFRVTRSSLTANNK